MSKPFTIVISLILSLSLASCGSVSVQTGQSGYETADHIDHAAQEVKSTENQPEKPMPPKQPAVATTEHQAQQHQHQLKHKHQNTSDSLKVVTWNVEHLAYPIDTGCKPRTEEQISALKAYAANLDADIVGLQEVASKKAVHLLFPEDDWNVIMSGRPDSESYECRRSGFTSTQQKVAFAVKKSVAVDSVFNLTALGLNRTGLRYGLVIRVSTPLGMTDILNVHLKSGCFVDNYQRNDSEACDLIAKQIPVLQDWITAAEATSNPYMIIGDINHRISAPYNRMTRDLRGTAESLYIVTRDLIGCHPWYPAPIDHIIVGNTSHHAIKMSAAVHAFDDMEVKNMLSDHCAISVEI